jgi:short-subunit dehydrogenase
MKQIAIVGGGGGLGGALVKQLSDQDCQTVVIGRRRPAEPRIQRFYAVDATRVDWRSLYTKIEQETSSAIDGMIFVAGTGVFGKTNLIPEEPARQTFELNFWACTAAAKAIAAHWDDKNQPGTFLAVLSIVARRAVPFEAYYAASKAATARFLECLQFEYAHKNIQIICAYPGMLRTPFRRQAPWYGFDPSQSDAGADVQKTAQSVINLLKGRRRTRVIGWRERSIDLTDRFLPGLYDRAVLGNRVRKRLKQGSPRA